MKKRKIISTLLVSLLALSVIGCGKIENKTVESTDKQAATDVVKEEAFTTVPEEKLVTDYIKKSLSHEDSFVEDAAKFSNLYINDTMDNDLIKKYNLEYDPKIVYKAEDLHTKYPELFEAGRTRLYTAFHEKQEGDDVFVNKKLGKQIIAYISDIWKDEKNTDYVLAKDFEKLNPKDNFKKYLKENKIEIKEITYPTFVTGFNIVPGADVATVKVTLKGTQNKKEFEKTLTLDFYFSPNDQIKNGLQNDKKISDKDFEIMAVSTGTVPADKFDKFFKYNINAAREKFGISQTK